MASEKDTHLLPEDISAVPQGDEIVVMIGITDNNGIIIDPCMTSAIPQGGSIALILSPLLLLNPNPMLKITLEKTTPEYQTPQEELVSSPPNQSHVNPQEDIKLVSHIHSRNYDPKNHTQDAPV